MKCLVHNCQNCSSHGMGRCFYEEASWMPLTWKNDKWICEPCYKFLTTNKRCNSQLEKNIEEEAAKTRDFKMIELGLDKGGNRLNFKKNKKEE